MNGRQRTTAAVALIGALVAAFVLHTSGSRPDVARIVPVALVWGATTLALAKGPPSPRHVLAAALVVRIVVVGSPAVLSDDLYRYLWEGAALLDGHDPLYTSPAELSASHPELAPSIARRVNHPELPSVYPPAALAWFALLSLLGGTVATVQWATLFADVATVAALLRLSPRGAWLYALLPLPVLESAAGGHIDVPAVAATAWAMVAFRAARPHVGAMMLILGLLTKLFPLVLLPTAWRALQGRARALVPLAALATIAAMALPFLRPELPAGVVAYGTRWSFNGLLHVPLAVGLGETARPVLATVGLIAVAAITLRARTVLGAWLATSLVFVAVTPTMHPWYLLWALVPSLAMGRREVAAASVFLPVSYAVLATWDPATASWDAGGWLWCATWIPAGAAAALAWRDRGTLRPTEDP